MKTDAEILFGGRAGSQLIQAGFPKNPKHYLGKPYRFECHHGSHHHILFGTIRAFEISDEGGLDVHVTNPRMWGLKLISLKYHDGQWMAYLDVPTPKVRRDGLSEDEFARRCEEAVLSRFLQGTFQLV